MDHRHQFRKVHGARDHLTTSTPLVHLARRVLRAGSMDVDPVQPLVFNTIEVQLVIPVAVTPDLERTALNQRSVLPLVLADHVRAPVLPRDQDRGPLDVLRMLQPIRARVGRRHVGVHLPGALTVPTDHHDHVVEAVGHVRIPPDTDDVQVESLSAIEERVPFPGVHPLEKLDNRLGQQPR